MVVALRRNHRFQWLWAGSAVSQLGTELTKFALPFLVLALTGSPGMAGVVVGTRTAAFVATQMPAGIWVDRWDRRRTLLVSQGVQLVDSAVLALLVVVGEVRIWHLLVLGAVDGICTAFGGPVRTAAIRAVVPPEQLRGAYAQEEARSHAGRLIGPPLGAFLFGLGRAVPFVVDVVTFLVSLLCSVFAKVPRRPDTPAGAERTSMRREAAEAVGWLWRQRGLRGVCAVAMAMNLLGGAILIPLIVLVGERGGDTVTTGAVFAGIGVGGLVGALLSRRIGDLLPLGKLLVAILALFAAADAVMVLPIAAWWPLVPLLATAALTPTLNVVMSVAVSRLVPEDMLGRVDALLTVVGMGLSPLAPVLGGLLAARLGGAHAILVIGAGFALTAVVAVFSRDLREFTDEPG